MWTSSATVSKTDLCSNLGWPTHRASHLYKARLHRRAFFWSRSTVGATAPILPALMTDDSPRFELVSPFAPAGDQPQAIAQLVAGFEAGLAHQTVLGVTGSGK